jgi:hypothetical protein
MLYELAEPRLAEPSRGLTAMAKLETPVVAGVGGVAVFAAILSLFGGGSKETPTRSEMRSTSEQRTESATAPGVPPNQEGPWRAVCEEYAPYPLSSTPSAAQSKGKGEAPAVPQNKIDLTTVSRGYKTIRQPSSIDGASEITIKDDRGEHKITVHKLLVGDLPSCIPPDKLGKIHFVLATLPDPDKTEMRLEFDRYVTALEDAAALRGYNFTGYWFPWRPRDNSPSPRREDEVEAQLLREEQPGVLLFRNNDGDRVFLFVVGETSTSGINRMQMAQALAYRQQLLECYNATDKTPDCVKASSSHEPNDSLPGPLLIAGPHFSGTLASLWDVLQSMILNPNTQIVIDSPDAAAGKLINDFQDKCKARRCSFRSISIRAADKDQAAVHYLASIGYDHKHIAELFEDESAFGNSEGQVAEVGEDASGQSRSPFGLKLSYPRELSAVRTLSDKQSEQVAASGSKFLSLSTAPSTVKLSGGESLERDRPFVYANDDEATEVSNALADDIRILRQKDIQCVVIGASNPLDRIYLLEYFHDKLPNVRLVVEDADELEINHPQFVDLVGTITISNLPVLPETVKIGNPNDGSSPTRYLAFASVAAAEEYLATAMLLGKDPAGDLSQQDGLAVSIVGEEGFRFIPFQESFEQNGTNSKWSLVEKEDKVELFGQGPPIDNKREPAPGNDISIQLEQSQEIPKAFIVLSLFVYVFTSIHLISIAKAEHPIAISKKLLGVEEAAPCTPNWVYGSRSGDPILDSGRVYNLFVLNNQLLLLNLLLLCATPDLSLLTTVSHIFPWLKAGAWTFLFLTGLLAIIYGCEYFCGIFKMFSHPGIPRGKKALAAIYSVLTVWYLSAGAIFLILWHSEAQKEWRRMLCLVDGISPVVPIAAVLLAWTLWGLVQTRRAKWVAYRKVDPISGGIGPISRRHHDLQSEVAQIHQEIEQTAITWRRLVVLFVAVGLTSWWQWTSLRSLEPEPELHGFLAGLGQVLFPDNFHWWYAIWGGIMLLATLIFSTYQLFKIWIGLSRLLHRLANTSMKEAFEKLGLDDKVQIKIWDLGKAEMRYSELFLTVKCLRSICGTETASSAEGALNDYETADFKNCQASLEQAKNLHDALTPGIFAAMALLEGSSIVVRDSRLEGELRRYLALRFVAFIRYVLLQMRNLTWFVVYGYFLACLSVKLYPFQGSRSLGDLLGLTFFIVLAMLGVMITGILRNPMLRLLEDKDSNAAGALQVILHLVTVGGVPVLALLAWQFPWIGQIAFSWLRPLWGAIH